jgi:hypothetical protein
MFYPQANSFSQGNFGYPQGAFGQGAFGPQGFQGASNGIPFANTLYGYPPLTPTFAQGVPQMPNWQHPAQLQAQLQAALQQQAILQLLAPQLAAQPFALQHLAGTNALNGLASGPSQSVGTWQQPQTNPEQIIPVPPQQSQVHLLQRLAQYHYWTAQQLAQLAAQQAAQSSGNPYAGQFVPGQFGASFVPGITMH